MGAGPALGSAALSPFLGGAEGKRLRVGLTLPKQRLQQRIAAKIRLLQGTEVGLMLKRV